MLRSCSTKGLKITAGDHTIAADALELSLATPGAKARELAALYAKHGQPRSFGPQPSVRSAGWPRMTRRSRKRSSIAATIRIARCGCGPG